MVILCSEDRCAYRSGKGYYGVCKLRSYQNILVDYGGIDRVYRTGCSEMKEKEED